MAVATVPTAAIAELRHQRSCHPRRQPGTALRASSWSCVVFEAAASEAATEVAMGIDAASEECRDGATGF